jgi:hypothetical protein
MVETGQAAAHDAGLSSLPSMGGLTFSGANAFPNATQAAFGGMGGLGYGVGYGGNSQGASISVPAQFFSGAQGASAPAGGASDYSGLIVIAGIVLAVILVIAMLGGKSSRKGRR